AVILSMSLLATLIILSYNNCALFINTLPSITLSLDNLSPSTKNSNTVIVSSFLTK
ncbi:13849_t:CDS:1, partial [Racocetra persica]